MLLSTASPHLGEESRLYDPEMFRCIGLRIHGPPKLLDKRKTNFLILGQLFYLDEFFHFFFILEIVALHPPAPSPIQNRVFSRCLKNVKSFPKMSYINNREFYRFLVQVVATRGRKATSSTSNTL